MENTHSKLQISLLKECNINFKLGENGFFIIKDEDKINFKKPERHLSHDEYSFLKQIVPNVSQQRQNSDHETIKDFGWALNQLKSGKRVMRSGWNGKNMYLIMFKGQGDIAKAFGYGFGEMVGEFSFTDVIAIKSAQETMVLGWHPSTPDMLSEDWELKTN